MTQQVWYVRGDDDGLLFDTKEAAELWARTLFPIEHPDVRYARIYFKTVHSLTHALDPGAPTTQLELKPL